jgi:hypothetical protein
MSMSPATYARAMPSSPGWVMTLVKASRRRIFSVMSFAEDSTVGSATLPSYASTRKGSSLLNTAATNVDTSMVTPPTDLCQTIRHRNACWRAW